MFDQHICLNALLLFVLEYGHGQFVVQHFAVNFEQKFTKSELNLSLK
jgi:hypothetical protein